MFDFIKKIFHRPPAKKYYSGMLIQNGLLKGFVSYASDPDEAIAIAGGSKVQIINIHEDDDSNPWVTLLKVARRT